MSDDFDLPEAQRLFEEAFQKQQQGNLTEAIELYSRSIELSPTPEAHTFLGWAYSLQNRYSDAIEECHKAIRLDPDYGNPYNDIGAYLIETGKYDEALPWLEKATQAKRYDSYCYPHYNMGRIWEKKGDWQRALQSYQTALQENGEYRLAKRAMNRIYSMLN